jgi:hypothetical protein
MSRNHLECYLPPQDPEKSMEATKTGCERTLSSHWRNGSGMS